MVSFYKNLIQEYHMSPTNFCRIFKKKSSKGSSAKQALKGIKSHFWIKETSGKKIKTSIQWICEKKKNVSMQALKLQQDFQKHLLGGELYN